MKRLLPPSIHSSLLALCCLAGGVAVPAVYAGDIVRGNTTVGDLNLGTVWSGGTAPTSTDRAVWNSSSYGGAQTIGANVSWQGILISSGVNATVTINNTTSPFTITLGSSGISLNNGSATSRGLTFNSNANVALGAAQTWAMGLSTVNLTVSSIISGTGPLTLTRDASGTSTFVLSNNNTFSGGLTVGNNAKVSVGQSSIVVGSTITSGSLGTSSLTLNDAAVLQSSSTAGRDLAFSGIAINGNVTIGEATGGTGRIRLNGAIDLMGGNRVVTLAASTATGNSGNSKFGFVTLSNSTLTNSVGNGTLTIQSSATGGNKSWVNFANQVNFTDNANLVLGANVVTTIGTNSSFGANASGSIPNLTIQSGGTLDLSDQTAAARAVAVASLSGAGLVTNGSNSTNGATLTINGTSSLATNFANFSGNITNGSTANMSLIKSGATTQILSGTNTYTGNTTINGGTLVFQNTSALSSGSTVNANTGTTAVGLGVGGSGDFTSSNITSLFAGNHSNIFLNNSTVSVGIYTTSNFTYSEGAASTSRGMIKLGSATLTLSGSNNYTGATTIAAGTLGLGASERIHDSSNLVLSGGNLSLGGFTETIGTLTLTANGTIDLGSGGTNVLSFADSSAASWTNGMVLSIIGDFVSGSSVRFGTSSSGLSETQIAQISIAGYSNLGINSQGFLTATAPIPEPSTYALLAGCAGLGLVIYRRRQQRQATRVEQKL
jgi:autotransporter-associated beta strand protein